MKFIKKNMKKLKIIVLVDTFLPEYFGGIQKSVLNEIEYFKNLGIKVEVVTRRMGDDIPTEFDLKGIKIYRLKTPVKGKKYYRLYPFFVYKYTPEIVKRLIERDKKNIIYSHDSFFTLGVLRNIKNVPLFFRFHAPLSLEIQIQQDSEEKYGKLKKFAPFARRFFYHFEKKAVMSSKFLLTTSEYMKSLIEKYYRLHKEKEIMQVPLCINKNRFKFCHNPLAFRKKLKLPSDKKILFTLRRLVVRTGIDRLIQAMRYVVDKYRNVILLIGGEGYLRNKLMGLIRELDLQENVRLLGFIPEEKLVDYYSVADFFVLPTYEMEGFGLVSIESMSCGTPVIATPVGANKEVVGGFSSDFISEDVTPEAIGKKVIDWLNISPERYKEIRKEVREYCVNNFSQEVVGNKLLKIFFPSDNKTLVTDR